MYNRNSAYLIEVFDEKRGHTIYLRRISLNDVAAVDWVYNFAQKYGYAVSKNHEGLYSKYKICKDGEHILTAEITNIALV